MKNYTSILIKCFQFIFLMTIVVNISFKSNIVHAYVIPTFSFSQANAYTTKITVYGDPDSVVLLHYGNLASSLNTIGTTDDSGSLSVSLSSSNYNISCGNTAYISINGIQSATIPWSPIDSTCTSMSLSQTSLNLSKGQSTSITATDNTNISISSNSNSSIVSSNVIGNKIYITALNYGTTNLIVCSNDNVNLCGSISISVLADGASSNVTFSQNNILLNLSDSQSVIIYGTGTGGYYISNNSNPTSVNASINGNVIDLHGLLFGTSTLNICQNNNGGCGLLNVSVTNNQGQSSVSSITPNISSLSFSVSNITDNKIESANNVLTLSFSTNVSINNPSVYVNNTKLLVSGINSGPYTATYNITGNEDASFPIVINFTSLAGNTGSLSFYVGDKMITSTSSTISTSSNSDNIISTNNTVTKTITNTKKTFVTNLKLGSTGSEVRSLQSKLKTLKFYLGVIDGKFGVSTENAVKAFQKAHKLTQSGNVGPKTRVLLNK